MWSSLFLFLKKGDLQDEATGEKEYTMLWKPESMIERTKLGWSSPKN